jgi:pimeloyl-ACP methyl ester carboxylesterase
MNTILLLHGAAGCGAQLQNLKELFLHDYKVYIPDFPGHGGTEMPGSFSIDFFAHHLGEYCKIHSIQNPFVFGYSMGGYVAVCMALKDASFFSGIVTLGTKFFWDEAVAAHETKMLQPQVIEQKLPHFAEALRAMHTGNDWKEVLHKTTAMLEGLGKNNLLSTKALQQVATPMLLMSGDRDKMIATEETLQAYNCFKNAQCAILPGTHHPIEKVDIHLLCFMIRRFINSIGTKI